MGPIRKSRKVVKSTQSSDSESDETSEFTYEDAIKKMSVSDKQKGELMKLCKKVQNRFSLTESQCQKVQSFRFEIGDSEGMQQEYSLRLGIYRGDGQEKPSTTSAFTDEEVQKIKENYNRFCEKFGFDAEKDINIFLPSTFLKRDGVHNLSHKQLQMFCRYLANDIDRPPRSVYKKFGKMFYFCQKGPYSEEEDELLLTWHKSNPGKHLYSFLGRLLRRSRQLVRRRTLRLIGLEDPSEKFRHKGLKIESMQEGDKYPDQTMDEEAREEIAESNKECTVKQQKSHFRDSCSTVKAASLVLPSTFISTLIKKLMSLKNPTWDNINWAELGNDCFNVGAAKVYSAVRSLTKKHVPKKHWANLSVALKIIKEKHKLLNEEMEIEDSGDVSGSASETISKRGGKPKFKNSGDVRSQDQNVDTNGGACSTLADGGDPLLPIRNRSSESLKVSECIDSTSKGLKFEVEESDTTRTISSKKELLQSDQFVDGMMANIEGDAPKKRKEHRKKSKENFDSCSSNCKEQSVDTVDGGIPGNQADCSDPFLPIGNHSTEANALEVLGCIDSTSERHKFKVEEPNTTISPKQVESDQVANVIANIEADAPKKRKKHHKKSRETLDLSGAKCTDQDVQDLDGDTSSPPFSKNRDCQDPLLHVENHTMQELIENTEAEAPKKRKKHHKKSRETQDLSGATCTDQDVQDLNSDTSSPLFSKNQDCREPLLHVEDHTMQELIENTEPDSPTKRKKHHKKPRKTLDLSSVTCTDHDVQDLDSDTSSPFFSKNQDCREPLLHVEDHTMQELIEYTEADAPKKRKKHHKKSRKTLDLSGVTCTDQDVQDLDSDTSSPPFSENQDCRDPLLHVENHTIQELIENTEADVPKKRKKHRKKSNKPPDFSSVT